jgi:two-component system nitrogen regulation sensor histidine kinase NtrY
MTLLVAFSAMWLGFYVARGITGPIQALADGTREVALGNYNITLAARSDDETGQLVRSFNLMTEDLRQHRLQVEKAQRQLLTTNEELAHRGKFLEILLKSMTSGVIAVDKDGFLRSINQAAAQVLSLVSAPLIGEPVKVALGGDVAREFWDNILMCLKDTSHFSGQIDITISGVTTALLVDAGRIVDEGGEDLGIVAVFDDASEKIKFQRIAAWREVARRIAHEIKNPVTPIKLNAQRLLRKFYDRFDGDDQDVFVNCLETILKQVDSLRDLVNEFSKFSRLPQIAVAPCQINEVIREVVDLYRLSYPTVFFDTSELQVVPITELDRGQMNRVFVNLVANALQAIENQIGKKVIAFRTSFLSGPHVIQIEIADNGPGIPADIRNRVLEPYFSTKDGGTGLGLAIVNQVVADHGGYLRIATNEPCGTRIILEIPLSRA